MKVAKLSPDGVSEIPDEAVSSENGFQRAHLKVVPPDGTTLGSQSGSDSKKPLEEFVQGMLNKKKRFDRRGVAIRAYEKASLLKLSVELNAFYKSV